MVRILVGKKLPISQVIGKSCPLVMSSGILDNRSMNNFIKNSEKKLTKKNRESDDAFDWDTNECDISNVNWREKNKNTDHVLKRGHLIESIDREKLIAQKIAEEIKENLLKLITRGNLQFRYETDVFTSENLTLIRSWINSAKAAFNIKNKISAELFVKLGQDENYNLILQIIWELPLAKIQNRFLVWNTLHNLTKFINSTKKNDDIVSVVCNKRDYHNSDLIGIYFSRKKKKEIIKDNDDA